MKREKEFITVTIDDNTGEVERSKYIEYKTKDLREFGYPNLTENEVESQLDKILNGDKKLSVIGMFIKSDIVINKPKP